MWKKCKRQGISIITCFIFIYLLVSNSLWSQTGDDEQSKIRTVVIDPGHGGKDSGATGKISKEKDIVLNISLLVGKYIEENIPDVKVIYTRKTDVFIELHKRAEIANENKADLFISIHADAVPNPSPYGTSTLVLGLHRSEENFEVAKRENSVILLEDDYELKYDNFDPNSPESYIMFTMMQSVYLKQSVEFAQFTQDQFRERAHRKDRGVKQQGLLVLARTSMPGVLIETGFVSNPNEESYLVSAAGQEYIASAIYRAFKNYKNRIESVHTQLQETVAPSIVNDTVVIKVLDTIKNRFQKSDSSLYFKVQIVASENKITKEDQLYEEFPDMEEFQTNTLYKYAVGSAKSYEELVEFSKEIKSRYPDAFIIAIKSGKIVPLQEVLYESKKTN